MNINNINNQGVFTKYKLFTTNKQIDLYINKLSTISNQLSHIWNGWSSARKPQRACR